MNSRFPSNWFASQSTPGVFQALFPWNAPSLTSIRQLFIHQPNRRFVRLITLSGSHLRLFHFDRSGVQYTPPFNIHHDPHTFVRLVLGLSSPNESDLGLDTSIQWTIENGCKVSGTLTTRAANNTEMVYPLVQVEPSFARSDIFGRCTTCWKISDPITGEELLVKDSWRSCDKIPEYVYLKKALNIPGVAQMVSHDPDRGQTKDFRAFTHIPADFGNRIDTRVIMKCYSPTVTKFTSARQLLCTLRDAISGEWFHAASPLPPFTPLSQQLIGNYCEMRSCIEMSQCKTS